MEFVLSSQPGIGLSAIIGVLTYDKDAFKYAGFALNPEIGFNADACWVDEASGIFNVQLYESENGQDYIIASPTLIFTIQFDIIALPGNASFRFLADPDLSEGLFSMDMTMHEFTGSPLNIVAVEADTSLASLKVIGKVTNEEYALTPAFAPDVHEYLVRIANADAAGVTLLAAATDPASTVLLPDADDLLTGAELLITVEGYDGVTVSVYKIVVEVLPPLSTALLSDIIVSEGSLTPGFSSEVTAYTLTLPYTSAAIGITPVVAPGIFQSALTFNGTSITSGEERTVSLNPGSNIVTIRVVAEDGTTYTDYVINVERTPASTVNTLSQIAVNSDGNVVLATFEEERYYAKIGENNAVFTFTPTVTPNAFINEAIVYTYGGTQYELQSGTPSLSISIDNGETAEIKLYVTAQSGDVAEYVLHVEREKSSDTSLASLDLGGIAFTPAFSPDRFSYNATVKFGVEEITFNLIPSSPHSTFKINGGENTVFDLTVGENEFVIEVISQSGAISTYTVMVYRQSNETGVSITVKDSQNLILPGAWEGKTYVLTEALNFSVSGISVFAGTVDSNALVKINGVAIQPYQMLFSGTEKEDFFITVEVTAEDGTVEVYAVVGTREAADTDNDLSDLTIDGVSVEGFDPEKHTYDIRVDYAMDKVTIGAVASSPKAVIVSGLGEKALSAGNNTVTIIVRSEAGVDKTYTLNIKRANADASLSNILVEGFELSPAFSKDIYDYTIQVPYSIGNIKLIGVKADEYAVVYGDGSFLLNVGENEFEIYAVSQAGTKGRTYTVVVNRAEVSRNAFLRSLEIEGYELEFSRDTFEYMVLIRQDAESVKINAEAEDLYLASVIGAGTHSLRPGNNRINITVVAEDGTQLVYAINLVRAEIYSGDNYLKSLAVIDYYIPFDRNTFSYTIQVGKDVNKVNLVYECSDEKATVTIEGNEDLVFGKNTVLIVVTAENGSERVYRISVMKEIEEPNNFWFITSLILLGTTVVSVAACSIIIKRFRKEESTI